MPVSVMIPTMLRNLTKDQDTVSIDGANVGEVISALDTQYPGIGGRLRNATGALNRFINFYVNDEDIRFLDGESTPLKDGDQLSIVAAVAGG